MKTNENCQWVQERIAAYRDGLATANEAAAVKAHLAECAACAAEAQADEQMVKGMRSLPPVEAPNVVWEQIRPQAMHQRKAWVWRTAIAVPAFVALVWAFVLPSLNPASAPLQAPLAVVTAEDRALDRAFIISSMAEPGSDPNRLILAMEGK